MAQRISNKLPLSGSFSTKLPVMQQKDVQDRIPSRLFAIKSLYAEQFHLPPYQLLSGALFGLLEIVCNS